MPIVNREDAVEVESRIGRIFAASSAQRAGEIRALFVEVLDFDPASGEVGLDAAPGNVDLPAAAERIAQLDGVHVLYVAVDTSETDRVRKGEAAAAARLIADQLGDDLLLVFTNTSVSQLHLIQPSFERTRPTLRRMIVERDLPRRTAVQQVSNIYWNHRDSGSIRSALDKAFDVEAVAKAFFEEYKRAFDLAMDRVKGFGGEEEEQESKKLFVQTLFNRLMFIYFLSRKGWLTFGGDKDYLNALWRDYHAQSEDRNFYANRLKPLFFAGLNNPQSLDLSRNNPALYALIGDVPFLNGGLFEENALDGQSGVTVPDRVIESIFSDLFGRFNFTVMESTPFDVEVAVDPEMLGKVFEELVTGRHDTGSYYTPRPIVSFMCREALKGYLEGRETGLAAEAIAGFVDDRDMSAITLSAARKMSAALDDVTVVDPACGSGAYLLGMMQELVDLQTALYSDSLRATARDLYDLKLHIIQRNLYGVDIDEFAVNIAMLRMWLSLAIEYEGERPEPLPNLDFKVVRGDSLLGPDPRVGVEMQGLLGRDAKRIKQVEELKAEYMRASVGTDKERLRVEIGDLEVQVKTTLGYGAVPQDVIEWRVQFAEVFDRGGFDVVLANPPYIQLQKDGGKLSLLYKDVSYATFIRTGDIYQLFYERGCQLLKANRGLLAYITSNSWLKAEYGKPSRRYLSEEHAPLVLLELGKDVFASAIVDTSVLLLREGTANGTFPAVDVDHLANGDFPPKRSLWGWVRPDGESPWSILSPLEQSVMDKMRAEGTPLKEWDVKINRGVLTGYNKAFIIDSTTRRALIQEDPSSVDIIKPVLRGRDIRRYRVQWAGLWLIAPHNGYDHVPPVAIRNYPAVKAHLDRYYPQLAKRQDKGKTPYNLRNCVYYEEFKKEKLFWMEMSDKGRFAYSDSEMYCQDTGFIMTGEALKYLCAMLNSSIVTWYIQNNALTTGMGLARWKKFIVERLPIPRITTAKQLPFIRLVNDILQARATNPVADTSELEEEIDWLAYDLYGLTDEETAVVADLLDNGQKSEEEEDTALATAIEVA